MRTLLELIRIIIIFAVLGSVLGYLMQYLYLEMGVNTEKYGWMSYISILILLFVLYRNKLQFSGWYNGEGREKLPKVVSQLLISCSIVLVLLPPFLIYF